MRYATMRDQTGLRPGLVIGSDFLDISLAHQALSLSGSAPASVREILMSGAAGQREMAELADGGRTQASRLRDARALLALDAVRLGPPLPDPGVILSIGANYHEHLKEMNSSPPKAPLSFYKNVQSIIGPDDKIMPPRMAPDMLDWEGEFSCVIGRVCHDVSAADALDYVAGYTIINDVSARDWVAGAMAASGLIDTVVAWEHNLLGKQFPTFCPMGPVITTADEITDPDNVRLETRLNGEVVQSANTSDLVFNIAAIIAHYSRFLTLLPGDVITTGSPSGVGYGRKPQVFMKPGDVIEVEVESIGVLRNAIA